MSCGPAVLKRIVETRPGSVASLERIAGMGPAKAERFGEAFLEILGTG